MINVVTVQVKIVQSDDDPPCAKSFNLTLVTRTIVSTATSTCHRYNYYDNIDNNLTVSPSPPPLRVAS